MLLVGSTSPIELDGRRIAERFSQGAMCLGARRGRRRIARGPARHVGDGARRPGALRRRRRPGHRRPSADRERPAGCAAASSSASCLGVLGVATDVPIVGDDSAAAPRSAPSAASSSTFYGAALLACAGDREAAAPRPPRGARPRPGQPVLPVGGDGRAIGQTSNGRISSKRHRDSRSTKNRSSRPDPRCFWLAPRVARLARRSAPVVERHRVEEGHRRLRREGDEARLAGLRPGRRAHRHLRQRRHALGRAADVFPAPLRARPRQGARARSIPSGRTRSRSPRCSRAT